MFKINPSDKQKIGLKGEEVAANYLKSQGFTIIGQNVWNKWGEIDLVAKQGSKWHFVEVKTVTRETFSRETEVFSPEDQLHPGKLRRLARSVEIYLLKNNLDEIDWQIDGLLVYLKPNRETLHVELVEDII
ncbi:MAG: YraN family protein [Candidatus Vogelbacteria bacterium]|nr:YraN family protein [Candidatus Vogelbacteria bacterium]